MSIEECLLIGPANGGKSLLLEKLRTLASKKERDGLDILSNSYSIPTIGVDVVNLYISELKRNINIREVGSSMTSQWYS